jgi:hypothetical protein
MLGQFNDVLDLTHPLLQSVKLCLRTNSFLNNLRSWSSLRRRRLNIALDTVNLALFLEN